jgi:hypothetical protein
MLCPPDIAQKIMLISSLFAGWGFISAADGSNVQNQPKP